MDARGAGAAATRAVSHGVRGRHPARPSRAGAARQSAYGSSHEGRRRVTLFGAGLHRAGGSRCESWSSLTLGDRLHDFRAIAVGNRLSVPVVLHRAGILLAWESGMAFSARSRRAVPAIVTACVAIRPDRMADRRALCGDFSTTIVLLQGSIAGGERPDLATGVCERQAFPTPSLFFLALH